MDQVLRDETLVASVASALTGFWVYLDAAADALAAGWGARGGRRRVLLAAARHAVDFHTWRSLARDGGVSRTAVVELASAMVSRASVPERHSPDGIDTAGAAHERTCGNQAPGKVSGRKPP